MSHEVTLQFLWSNLLYANTLTYKSRWLCVLSMLAGTRQYYCNTTKISSALWNIAYWS